MKYTKEKLEKAVQSSLSLYEATRKLGIIKCNGGGTYYHLRKKIKEFGIDTTHFKKRIAFNTNKNKKHWSEYLTVSEFRIEGKILRRSLIEYGKEYKCVQCDNKGYWHEKILLLQVDHINNDPLNNKPENLQFLCPNCHSTKTFSHVKHPTEKHKKDYKPNYKIRKVERPSRDNLEEFLNRHPITYIANQFGVSDHAVRKWAMVYNLSMKPRGYWQKINKNKRVHDVNGQHTSLLKNISEFNSL